MEIIDRLLAEGLVLKIMGNVTPGSRLALVTWARNKPKDAFRAIVSLSKILSQYPLLVFVDDLCTRIFTQRNKQEQEFFNRQYYKFFTQRSCKVTFTSQLYSNMVIDSLFGQLMELGCKVPVMEFIRCLPENKRNNIE
ncbi:MAG: hypothetical protein ACPL3B_07345, partial [Fervidobacterium sp.]